MSQSMLPEGLEAQLQAGLDELGIVTDAATIGTLVDYVALLTKWNKAFNLTAVRHPADMVSRHLLDSLSVLPWVKGPRLLDVGSGPGLPGIVLAILRPDIEVTLLDSNGKKVRFQRQAVLELGLSNVFPVHSRIEEFVDEQGFDQIISRAFASVDTFVELTRSQLSAQGEWLAMMGRIDSTLDIPDDVQEQQRIELKVPGESAARHLVRLAVK